jgi:hypothetical protein
MASAGQAQPSILIPVKWPSFLVSSKNRSNIGDVLQTPRTWLPKPCLRLVALGGGADFSGLQPMLVQAESREKSLHRGEGYVLHA